MFDVISMDNDSYQELIKIAKLALEYADHIGYEKNSKWVCDPNCDGCMIQKVLEKQNA